MSTPSSRKELAAALLGPAPKAPPREAPSGPRIRRRVTATKSAAEANAARASRHPLTMAADRVAWIEENVNSLDDVKEVLKLLATKR